MNYIRECFESDDDEVSDERHEFSNDSISVEEIPTNKPYLQRLFTITISGNRILTTVTRRACTVRRWVSRIRSMPRYRAGNGSLVVGLGVQWPPPIDNTVGTLQLCVGSRCLIFQIGRANSIPLCLRNFLSNENGRGGATFVGIRNYQDAWLLARDFDLHVKPLLELGCLAGASGNFSMGSMARSILHFNVTKSEWVGTSDWDQRELTDEQVEYAGVDAFVSFQIGRRLRAWKYVH